MTSSHVAGVKRIRCVLENVVKDEDGFKDVIYISIDRGRWMLSCTMHLIFAFSTISILGIDCSFIERY